jgi:protein transport protein SEC20
MSFEVISERLTALQDSNTQLKDLIDRLATIRFQPGSIPLDDDEDNVMTELTSEIQQTLREVEEDWESLEEDVLDLSSKGEEGERRRVLVGSVGRGMKVLRSYV